MRVPQLYVKPRHGLAVAACNYSSISLDTALGHREKGGGGNIEVLLFVEPVNIGREIQFEPKALNDDQHSSTGTMARKTV